MTKFDFLFLFAAIGMFFFVIGNSIYKSTPATNTQLQRAQTSSSCVKLAIEQRLQTSHISKNELDKIEYVCVKTVTSDHIRDKQKESLK